jgi:hypothetical protein
MGIVLQLFYYFDHSIMFSIEFGNMSMFRDHEVTVLQLFYCFPYIVKCNPVPVILYGCETWSLTLREEHRLRVFKNRVLRRIFELKRDEVTGGWRKLYNEELHNLYSSPSIIRMIKSRRMRWVGHVA